MKKNLTQLRCLFILLLAACTSETKNSGNRTGLSGDYANEVLAATPESHYLITWPRMNAAAFGCMLEKNFGHKDAFFNCSLKGSRNLSNPCDDAGGYYKGPVFPAKSLPLVHPEVAGITLAFEHGELQEVTLMLKKSMPLDQARLVFSLPAPGEPLPANIMDIQYTTEKSSPGNTSQISLVGFEHLGVANLDCDGDEAAED